MMPSFTYTIQEPPPLHPVPPPAAPNNIEDNQYSNETAEADDGESPGRRRLLFCFGLLGEESPQMGDLFIGHVPVAENGSHYRGTGIYPCRAQERVLRLVRIHLGQVRTKYSASKLTHSGAVAGYAGGGAAGERLLAGKVHLAKGAVAGLGRRCCLCGRVSRRGGRGPRGWRRGGHTRDTE